MPTITYYMSLNSPWTYLGSARFADMAKRHGYTVDIRPAKFGEIFPKTGGFPLPKRSPERRAYRMMELKRWREQTKLPITLEPKYFPSDETLGSRLVIAAKLQGRDAHALATELGRAIWEREENLGQDAVVAAAAKRAGLDADAIRKSGPSDAELDKLHDQFTAEALKQGVFGAPSYVLESGEFFWGQDRLDFLERALTKK